MFCFKKLFKFRRKEKEIIDIQNLFSLAGNGNLSIDFYKWDLADKDGWTLAHEAAMYGRLPKKFRNMDRILYLYDKKGMSVIKLCVFRGDLPDGFDNWSYTENEKYGWSLAHVAAFWGTLPKSFDQWRIADAKGWTVAHEAAKYDNLPKDFSQWDLKDNKGVTVADVYKNKLPSRYKQQ